MTRLDSRGDPIIYLPIDVKPPVVVAFQRRRADSSTVAILDRRGDSRYHIADASNRIRAFAGLSMVEHWAGDILKDIDAPATVLPILAWRDATGRSGGDVSLLEGCEPRRR